MKYIPFKQFGEFFFSESFQEIEKKVKAHGKVDIGHAMELGKRYPSIYIPNTDLFIVFVEDSSAVRYVETKADIVILECNLLTTPPKEIKEYFSKYDDSITLNDEGSVESKKYGFIISREGNDKQNQILLFNDTYLDEEDISPDDIIKFYLGKDKGL